MIESWVQAIEKVWPGAGPVLRPWLARLGLIPGSPRERIVPQQAVTAFLAKPPQIDMSGGDATKRSLEALVARRIALGWQRTDGHTPYLPDLPKLFYVARHPFADDDVRTMLEAARQSIRWRSSKTPEGDTTAWTQTHAVSAYARHSLDNTHQVRGFRGRLAVPPDGGTRAPAELSMEVFVYVNRISPDPSVHHAVLSLAFDMTGPDRKWGRSIEEQRVSEVVAGTALRLGQRLAGTGEILLLEGAWRYVFFDVPYEASSLARYPDLVRADGP